MLENFGFENSLKVLEEPKPRKKKKYKDDEGDINTKRRYQGLVTQFYSRKGFGFIKPDIKNERIFIHWQHIKSTDSWPALKEGMRVAFYIGTQKDGRLFAADVTDLKGNVIALEKENIKIHNTRTFPGKVRYYDMKKGFGFLEVLETIKIGKVNINSGGDLYCDRSEIVSEDSTPALKVGTEVEFHIKENDKGLVATNVRLKGGGKISYPQAERNIDINKNFCGNKNEKKFDRKKQQKRNRRGKRTFDNAFGSQFAQNVPGFQTPNMQVLETEPQIGEVDFWHNQRGYGWISPFKDLSGYNGSNRVYFRAAHVLDPTLQISPRQIVQFVLYCDAKGLGAMEIQLADEIQREQVLLERPHKRKKKEEPRRNMFGPSATVNKETDNKLQLQIDQAYIGTILANLDGLQNASGCELNVLPSTIEKPSSTSPRICVLRGTRDSMKTACRLITQRIAEVAQSLDAKVVFLISENEAGRFIGKKGANIKKLRDKSNIQINVARIPVLVQGKPMKTCALMGSLHAVFNTLDATIELLGEIFHKNFYSYKYEPPANMNLQTTQLFGAELSMAMPGTAAQIPPPPKEPIAFQNPPRPPPISQSFAKQFASLPEETFDSYQEPREEEAFSSDVPLPAPTSYY